MVHYVTKTDVRESERESQVHTMSHNKVEVGDSAYIFNQSKRTVDAFWVFSPTDSWWQTFSLYHTFHSDDRHDGSEWGPSVGQVSQVYSKEFPLWYSIILYF